MGITGKLIPIPRGSRIVNRERQAKKEEMAAAGILKGKSYRRWCKKKRRELKND